MSVMSYLDRTLRTAAARDLLLSPAAAGTAATTGLLAAGVVAGLGLVRDAALARLERILLRLASRRLHTMRRAICSG